MLKKANSGAGTYRLTFSFDSNGSGLGSTLNTFFDNNTAILVPEEEGEISINAVSVIEPRVAKIDVDNNLTYIDVIIKTGQGGGSRKPTSSIK
jgi:hypothetical protein